MRNSLFILLAVFGLTACGGEEVKPRPKVSYQNPPSSQAITYGQFRTHEFNAGSDMSMVQKRFVMLDRDNNGVLSQSEFSGF